MLTQLPTLELMEAALLLPGLLGVAEGHVALWSMGRCLMVRNSKCVKAVKRPVLSAVASLVRAFCEGDGDVVGVVTPLGGVAQAFHGDQVVELRVQLAVQEVEGKEEDREGQVEVEEEKRLKEKRT